MKIINKVVNIFVALCLLLSLSVNAYSDVNLDTSADTSIQIPEKYFYNSGIDSASELKQFFDELKIDIASNNKQGVAAKISYPISIRISKERVLSVKTRADFIAHYDEIINQQVKDAVSKQDFNEIRGYSSGVRIGRGVIWIGAISLGNDDPAKIKIYAINNRSLKRITGTATE
ncbi:hypothetical protein [uncultured Shewanella sp.]|uniref:hypothetical protein n=1 Tax=uncultured Shewanella sp. TaxID=173975 RepID=UPI0026269C37|nr:hypothetical protein [uncultured Shewanella sp.]